MTVRRPLLKPLVPIYRAAVSMRNRWYDSVATPRILHDPVLSIGSIAAGGAGKTPFLAALARLLRTLGYAPDVLSRGYGRSSRGVLRVYPEGTARQFGDEPLMLARALHIPVIVGSSRYAAGCLAEREPDTRRVHLMDDGFNHRALARTLDIALLTLEDAHDVLLPAGNLREPLHCLRRADVLVLRAPEAAMLMPLARGLLVDSAKPVWTITRRVLLPANLPSAPILFSGIARPGEFEAMAHRAGIRVAGVRRFADHHLYTPAQMDALRRYGRASHADGFLTTAKDAVKLTGPMLDILHDIGPIAVADAIVEFEDADAVSQDLLRVLQPPVSVARAAP